MDIFILARKSGTHFNKKIESCGKSDNIKVEVIDPLACELLLDGLNSQVIYNGKPLKNPDYVIPRMGRNILSYGMTVLKHFEMMGVPTINSSYAITNILNRYEYLQQLSSHKKLQVPKSMLLRKSNQIKNAMEKVQGPPVILKMLSGKDKLGAMLIDDPKSAESFLDVNSIMGGFGQLGQDIVIEQFIKETEGKSIHLLVFNGEVLGGFYKLKAFNAKQSSLLLGDKTTNLITPDSLMSEKAVLACNILNLDFALVSFLESIDEPIIYEININPEIEIFEKDSRLQIPAKIVGHMSKIIKQSKGIEVNMNG